MLRLNLGCGKAHYEGFVNIDKEESVKPDLLLDFVTQSFPYEDNSVEDVYFIHTIEHIEEKYHFSILSEIWRVLIPDGQLMVAYPEFSRCAMNYINNYRGRKEFWKHTIYGRQLYPSDFHVSLMDTKEFVNLLEAVGFNRISYDSEPGGESHNTVVLCYKNAQRPINREDLIRNEILESSKISSIEV